MKHKLLLAAIQLVAFGSVSAQNVNGLLFDATNTVTRDASAAFEINANTNTPGSPLYGGLLLPRVALTGTTDATTIAGTEATSLLVYNTATVSDVTPGFYYWNGSSWLRIISGNGSFPTGSGTTNYLARWTSASTLGIGVTYDNGTNVGISTTGPAGKLDVRVAGAGTWDRFVVKTSSLWGDGLGSPAENGGTEYVTIGAGGAAGIMISNPHVVWNAGNSAAAIRYGRGGGISSGEWWEGGINSSSGFHIRKNAVSATGIDILNNGNVGIGSATPGWKLDVNGNARIGANTSQNTIAALAVSAGQGSATTYRDIDLHGNWSGNEGHAITASHATGANNIVGQIVFEHNSPGSRIKFGRLYHSGDQTTYPMELVSNGSDAILRMNTNAYTYYGPNTSWGAYLQVGGNGRVTTGASVAATNGNLHLDAADGGFATYINYYSQNNTYINAQAGNVGIGNTGPSYKLDVIGDTRTTGDFFGDVHVDDTRNVNDPPTTYNNEVAFDFKARATIGVPGSGTYSGNMTIAPWGDNSGDASHQINFNEGGLFWRQGQPDAGTWDAWSQILTSSNNTSGAILNQYTAAQTASFWISGNAQVGSSFTNLNGRLLTSNQSGWQADGVTPQMVISANSASTNRAALIGLDLHNDNTTNNVYAPFITFSRRSNGTAYNSAFAAIGAQVTGQGTDANWCAGDLIFATENGTVNGMGERMRIDKSGRVYILQNQGGDPNFAGLDDPTSANGRAQLVLSSSYSDLVIASSEGNDNHGSTLTFATYNPGNTADYRKFVINQGNWGVRRGFLDFGFSDAGGRSNPHSNINNGDNVLSLDGFNKRVGVGTMSPVSTLNVVGKSTMSRDNATECCGNDATLALAESTSGSGRRAGISFHNGGVAEGTLELANGGPRRIRIYDNQNVGMGLEMTGDFINQNVEWNQATSSNYTVGANSGQHVINNSTVTLSKSSGNATNNGYSVVLLVANVTASGNDITWANGIGGYQTVQSLGHGVAGYRVYLQRSTDNVNWTTLISGSAIVGMQVGDYYMQYSGITSMVGISGDAFKFSNNVSLNYIDNVGAGTYYYRLLFETTGYNKNGGNYLISDRALSVVEIKR